MFFLTHQWAITPSPLTFSFYVLLSVSILYTSSAVGNPRRLPFMVSKVGDRVTFRGGHATVRFVGEVSDTGVWLGIEWDDPSRGRHDGTHNGHRYFECR